MFVTLIIGVLIAIAIAVYVATIPGAEAATCRSNQRMLEEGGHQVQHHARLLPDDPHRPRP